jgi:hypothetical protein
MLNLLKQNSNSNNSYSSEDDMRGTLDLIAETVEDMYKSLNKFDNMKDINKTAEKPITQREYTKAKATITASIMQLNHLVNNLQIMTQYLN